MNLMNVALAAPNDLLHGRQSPRILTVPDYVSSTGQEAIDLVAMAGLDLDPWQQLVLIHSLGERPDGRWSAFEVGVEVARQNGKGGILEARELAGLFLLGERLIIHSAHEFATAIKALDRMEALIDACPDFKKRLKPRGGIVRSHGFEAIRLKNGQSLEYRTRTKGGGRGFSCDCLILDEAMHIPEAMHGALMPTLSARPNPQIWYTGSAVDQETMDNGIVFARVRERAVRGGDPALAYFGWSPDFDDPEGIPDGAMTDPDVWAQSNPALGIRITSEHVEREQRSMAARTFAVERLGVGDWPDTDPSPERKIDAPAWKACLDADVKSNAMLDPVCFAFDVTPARSSTAIAVAGFRADGLPCVEIADLKAGTAWLPQRVADLVERHESLGVVWCKNSPAASLVSKLDAFEVASTPIETADQAKACGAFYDAVEQVAVRHLGSSELASAIKGAQTRPLGDAWLWSRRSSGVNIAPLVAVTMALWGLSALRPESKSEFSLADYRITQV